MRHLQTSRHAGKMVDIRGTGLFIGVQLDTPDATAVLHRSIELGLIVNLTQKNVLRICPALTVTDAQLQQGMELLDQALDKL